MELLKGTVRRLLNRLGSRHRISDSWWYQTYLFTFYPRYFQQKRAERRFYRTLIGSAGTGIAFDIGANVGDKTKILAAFVAKVVSVEPTPSLTALLEERFCDVRNVIIVSKGVGAIEGTATLNLFGGGGGCNTFSRKR